MTPAVAPSRISARRFRENLAATLGRVATDGRYVIVTRRGVPVAAVVPLGVLHLLDATEFALARRTLAAARDVHDVTTAACDVPPRATPAADLDSRSRQPVLRSE